MRRAVIWAAAVLLAACAPGELLPHPREMGELALVRVMGVDADGSEIEVSVSAGESDGEETPTLAARGASVSAAARSAQELGDGYLYYGHVEQILIGQEAAQEVLPQILDYLCRERALGLGAQVWIVRDGTARQALDAGSGADVSRRLALLSLNSRVGRTAVGRTAMELAAALARGESVFLPALVPDPEGRQGLLSGGYAVVRDGKTVCFPQGDAALGLEVLAGYGRGRVDDLTLPDGTQASFALENVRVRARAGFEDGELTGLDVRLDLPVRTVQAQRRLTGEDLVWIERELGILEGQRAVETLELAQYWDADFAGLQARACTGDPAAAERIAEAWPKVFRTLEIRVQAHCRVERTTD